MAKTKATEPFYKSVGLRLMKNHAWTGINVGWSLAFSFSSFINIFREWDKGDGGFYIAMTALFVALFILNLILWRIEAKFAAEVGVNTKAGHQLEDLREKLEGDPVNAAAFDRIVNE